jgi:cytochrome d ubiquinol oxidase subunit I
MELDALLLSRIQFAFTITFHIIFPAFTIGLASWLVALEFQWLRTGDQAYRNLYRFWVKIFAVSFGLGVVSGIVMTFQFGTNWSRFSEFTRNILGPLIQYEVITAFFLEAGFLGIMLFGWRRVGDRLHFLATCLVAFGTLMSAFWILSANSWMQTPAGHAIENGIAVPVDWWRIVFNPSFGYRFLHMVLGCYLTAAFAVAGMSAFMLLRARGQEAGDARLDGARRSLSMALWFGSLAIPVQIVIGDLHGLGVLEYQPAKLAAIEGNWVTQGNMPLRLLAIPDEEREINHYELAIPKIGSWVLTHAYDGIVPGLKDFPRENRPPVWPVFFSFRIMVGLGLLMLAVGLWSFWLRWQGRLFATPSFLWACLLMTPSGFAAVVFGWFTAEIGRQPWVVYGLLRTADAYSPVAASSVATSLAAFAVAYAFIFGFGTYYLVKLLLHGPGPVEAMHDGGSGGPKRPLAMPVPRDRKVRPAGGPG